MESISRGLENAAPSRFHTRGQGCRVSQFPFLVGELGGSLCSFHPQQVFILSEAPSLPQVQLVVFFS